ncbi:PREDICTED: kunitz-type protease inhibitor 1-like [Cyprinodon variegatus]|uniref:kunitz-type protease inhibitor 1-like n=1 Tax=Cyprinodon variegatus TaxID=28743 RepID=UPI0007427A02|nr:PREDICTED: kunitz-type protease inhibitor 1-like [Cyprinodon variegatus]
MVSCRSEQNPALSFQLPEMFWFCWTFSALLLCGARRVAAEECGAAFRSGRDNFVLDLKDAVGDGAALLDTRAVSVDEDCQDHCCTDPRCNLALLKPRDENATENTRTCILIDCVHKNRFVCRFVNQAGYQSYIRESMFQKYLQAPGEQPPPIANAGRDVVVQPGETVTLNGTESVALGNAKIATYRWSLQSGDRSLKMENTDLLDQQRLSNLQPGSYVLKLTVTDSNGRSGEDEVSVLVLSSELSSLPTSSSTDWFQYRLVPVPTGSKQNLFSKGMFERLGTDEDVGESGSVALAVVLAVAILALLAILGYCFFRRRRNPSSRPPGPPHVELSQEDSLVYNSTTKPA